MMNNNNNENGMNRTRIDTSSMPDRVYGEEQPSSSRNPTAKLRWTKEINKIVMECYIRSDPSKRGYRKRMLAIWREIGVFQITEQRLADQARAIRTNTWLTDIEIEELKRKIEQENIRQEENVEPNEEGLRERESTSTMRQSDGEVNANRDRQREESNQLDQIRERMRNAGSSIEKITILEMIFEEMEKENPLKPMNLRNVERSILKTVMAEVNEVVAFINTKTITDTNTLLNAAAVVVGRRLGIKRQTRKNEEPWWKRRIQQKIKQLRQDISRLDRIKSGNCTRNDIKQQMRKKYNIPRKRYQVVLEELKQRLTAQAAKLKRYEDRGKFYNQNRLFESNQRRLFEDIEGVERDNIIQDVDESRNFWDSIWGESTEHNSEAEWIKELGNDLIGIENQENIDLTVDVIEKQIRKMPNWKSPGPDGMQGYWIKNFTSLKGRIASQLNDCLQHNSVPDWMTKGRTVLVMKDKDKGGEVTNFRPITCLPVMWKLLTGVLADKMYEHLEEKHLLPEEQKGCRRKSKGTKDQLLIDKLIIKNCKRRKTGLAMAWVDYRKAFDMVPHSWILHCMTIFGVAQNLIELIQNSMCQWKTTLSAGSTVLGEIHIKRGIFQGDSLSPILFVLSLIPLTLVLRKIKMGYDLGGGSGLVNHLIFMDDLKLYGKNENQVDSLIQSVRIVSEDIRMEFGISKCATLTMKRGKVIQSEGIHLPGGKKIRSLKSEDNEGYKYLGVLEADDIKHAEMKEKIQKEYFRRLRTILKSKLNGGNTIKAINTRAVSIIRYGAGIIDWTKAELQQMDRKTRKLMTIYRTLHPQADVDRLYVKRSKGGRGMISIEECVNVEVNNLSEYIQASQERMLKAVGKEKILKEREPDKDKVSYSKEHAQRYHEKPLHGQFVRGTEQIRDQKSWEWLKRGKLKRESEGFLMAAQDQALRTNSVKKRIDNQDVSPACRMCGTREETVSHILAECTALAQKQYKLWRHDRVAQVIHWKLSEKYGFTRTEKWYDHKPEPVCDSEKFKLLWDFKIQTDHHIEHNKPDILLLNKEERSCWIIDIACPFDTRIVSKEREKVENYHDLKIEIKRIWNCRSVKIIPIIIGALGTISKGFEKWLNQLEIPYSVEMLQRVCLLGSGKILRKVLDT